MNIEEAFAEIENSIDYDVFKKSDLANPGTRENYCIANDAEADRILGWYNKKSALINENKDMAKKMKEDYSLRIDAWLHEKNKHLENSVRWYSLLLTDYLNKQYKGANISLPLVNGTIKFTQPADGIEYDDEIVLNWLKDNNLSKYIRTKESIDKVPLKKDGKYINGGLSIDGMVIPGISRIPKPLVLTLPDGTKIEKEDAIKKNIDDDIPF